MEASVSNSRSGHRQRTLKLGKVVLSDWSTIDCAIRDLSETGARLAFDGPVRLPSDFKLLTTTSGLLTPAEAVWQRGLLAGIRFTGPARPAPPRRL